MTQARAEKRPALAGDLLAIDVGNSKVAAVLFRAGKECFRWRVDYGEVSDSHWTSLWQRGLDAACALGAGSVAVVMASVAPQRAAVVERRLRRAGLSRIRQVSWRDPWPYSLEVRHPASVGADRLANVAGLVALGVANGVAIDAGTAVTLDVLERGRFRGGVILPGFSLLARALHSRTAQLPEFEPRVHPERIGRDTLSALQAGVHHGLSGAVATIAAGILAPLGRGARLVFTGADGERLLAGCAVPRAVFEPELLFLGLRAIVARTDRRPG